MGGGTPFRSCFAFAEAAWEPELQACPILHHSSTLSLFFFLFLFLSLSVASQEGSEATLCVRS
jgi:hypothetical protein